jgi:hypothetical protein
MAGDRAESDTPTDYYDLLDVPEDAATETIEAAFRELVRHHHPDVSDHPDAERRFRVLRHAHDVLTDPDERKRYDRLGHDAYLGESDVDAPIEPASAPEEPPTAGEGVAPSIDLDDLRAPEQGATSGGGGSAERFEGFRTRAGPAEWAYPDWPYPDPVPNLALRAWLLRLAPLAAVWVGAASGLVTLPGDAAGAAVLLFGLLLVGYHASLGRRFEAVGDDPPSAAAGIRATMVAAVAPVVGWGAAGAGLRPDPLLRTAGFAFAGAVLAVVAAATVVGASRRTALAAGTVVAAGVTPAVVPGPLIPGGGALATPIGVALLATLVIGLLSGTAAVSRFAWALGYGAGRRLAAGVWDGVVLLPLAALTWTVAAGQGVPVPAWVDAVWTVGPALDRAEAVRLLAVAPIAAGAGATLQRIAGAE